MKKIILFLVCVFFIQSIEDVSASTVYELFSNNNTVIQSDGILKNEQGNMLVVQNSNLKIIHTPSQDINESQEPKIDIRIKSQEGEEVFSLQSPSGAISGENPAEIDVFLEENEIFLSHVEVIDSSMIINIPIKFSAGLYVLETSFDESASQYEFEVGQGAYVFNTVEIIAEDGRVFIKAPYTSFSSMDDTQNLVITFFDKDKNVLYKHEEQKTLYESGEIYHDINFDNQNIEFEIELKLIDETGTTLLSFSKKVNNSESPSENGLVILIIASGLLLFVLLIAFIKHFKKHIPLAILCFMFFGFSTVQAQAPETCENKPDAYCLEGEEMDYVCQLSNEDCVKSSNEKLFFNNGIKQNVSSPLRWVGPVDVSINICNSMSSLNNGDKFYVLSDSLGSSWTTKRYHIYTFVKGTSQTLMYDPLGRKRNVNYATYDGGCVVRTFSRYTGPSSNWKWAQTKIVEVGKINSDICRSRVVNSDIFEEKGNLLDSSICDSDELQDKFIVGSKYIAIPPAGSSWAAKKVNICSPLGLNDQGSIDAAKISKKSFYFLLQQTGSWIYLKYPIFQFELGVAKNLNYNFSQRKNNLTHARYDGNCEITFYLQYTGKDTEQWDARFRFWEVGFVEDAMCYDPEIETAIWATSFEGLKKNYYPDRAPFMLNMRKCFDEESCTLKKEWVEFSTGNTCVDCFGTYIPPGEMCTSTGDFSVSCVADPSTSSPGQSVTLRATTYNSTSTVTYSWSNEVSSYVLPIGGTGSSVAVPPGILRLGPALNRDTFKFNVRAQDANGNVSQNSCYATVAIQCDDTYDEGQLICNDMTTKYDQASCTASGWRLTPTTISCETDPVGPGKINMFRMNPGILIPPTGFCKANVEVENMQSCSIVNTSGDVLGTGLSGVYDISQPGVYKLVCTGLDASMYESPTQRCVSNLDIRES